jgi:sulfatase modifying factor 1
MQAPMTIKQYVSQMRKIPGGRFTMGRTYKDEDIGGNNDELPAHPVDISTFRLGATPITVGMWREYVRKNVHLSMPKTPSWDWIDDHPMVNISWNDIMGDDGTSGYCEWASRVSGVQLLLPSEGQYEYVLKGGSNGRKFPWGNSFDESKLWCSRSDFKDVGRTAPVIRSANIHVNEFGLSDLVGNVMQWCLDTYKPYSSIKRDRLGYPLIQANPVVTGQGPMSRRNRVIRGGGWYGYIPLFFRCDYRYKYTPNERDETIGFRLSGRGN